METRANHYSNCHREWVESIFVNHKSILNYEKNPTEPPLMVRSDHNVNVSESPRGIRCSSRPWGSSTQKSLNQDWSFFLSAKPINWGKISFFCCYQREAWPKSWDYIKYSLYHQVKMCLALEKNTLLTKYSHSYSVRILPYVYRSSHIISKPLYSI